MKWFNFLHNFYNVKFKMKNVPELSIVASNDSKRWPQFLIAFSVNIIVFSTGCHTGWPSPSVPKLLSNEYPHDVTSEEASYITIIGNVGNICGGLFGSLILDKIGRRKTILLIALPQLISFSLIILSYHVMELLYVARFIGGVSEGMTLTIIPLYMAEIAEPTIRGVLSISISVTFILGMLYINIVGSYTTIKVTAFSLLIFPMLFVFIFWRMPESPYFLLMKNRQKQAEKALKFLKRKESVSEELTNLTNDVNRQMSEAGTFRDIFSIDSNRKAFLLAVGARFFQQFTGASAFNLYAQVLLSEATDSLPPHIGATILFSVQLLMCLLSGFFVDRYGRKPLLLFSTIGCCLVLTLQTIYFTLKEHADVDVSAVDWLPLVMMIIFVILYSIGLGTVVTLLCGELFSASIKSKTGCLVNIVFSAGVLTSTKYYQATSDAYGLTVPFSSFAIITFLGVMFLYFCVPETKGKSLEQIQQLLKGNANVINEIK